MHPADWKKLSDTQKWVACLTGDADPAIHWKVQRVAELTGLDPKVLDWHVEAERGWESHDKGYLHEVVVSARILLYGSAE